MWCPVLRSSMVPSPVTAIHDLSAGGGGGGGGGGGFRVTIVHRNCWTRMTSCGFSGVLVMGCFMFL